MSLLKKNKFIVILLFIALLGIGVWSTYRYVFVTPTKASEVSPDFIGEAKEFKYLFTEDIKYWNNKVVQIKGKVSEINEYGILLNENIFCQFEQNIDITTSSATNDILIKGKVVGFDELLMEIKLNQCVIIQ
jgi:hypothetical protein